MPILLDTGFFIALIDPTDNHSLRADEILIEIKDGQHGQPFTSAYVMAESAVLVAVRTRNNYDALKNIKSLFIGEESIAAILDANEFLREKAWDLFLKLNQDNKNQPVSYVNSLNIIIAQHNHIGSIAAFDGHYEGWLHLIA
jgi:predicted nucleic acid-binding protein